MEQLERTGTRKRSISLYSKCHTVHEGLLLDERDKEGKTRFRHHPLVPYRPELNPGSMNDERTILAKSDHLQRLSINQTAPGGCGRGLQFSHFGEMVLCLSQAGANNASLDEASLEPGGPFPVMI